MVTESLLADWQLHLRVLNRSPRTIDDYVSTARRYRRWCEDQDRDGMSRRDLQAYLAELQDTRSHAYAAKVYRTLRVLFVFLADEELITANPFDRMKAPSVPDQPVPVFTDEEVGSLLRGAAGKGFTERRDTLIIRLLLDTGMRVAELVGIKTDDIDMRYRTVGILGKGRKLRLAPFGYNTAEALRRYLRVRASHAKASCPELLIAAKGPVTDSGVRQILNRRAGQAGMSGVYPHKFRHYFAHTWLANGGQETDLMRLTGWSSRAMLSRYGKSAADDRAREAHRRHGLGDRF